MLALETPVVIAARSIGHLLHIPRTAAIVPTVLLLVTDPITRRLPTADIPRRAHTVADTPRHVLIVLHHAGIRLRAATVAAVAAPTLAAVVAGTTVEAEVVEAPTAVEVADMVAEAAVTTNQFDQPLWRASEVSEARLFLWRISFAT